MVFSAARRRSFAPWRPSRLLEPRWARIVVLAGCAAALAAATSGCGRSARSDYYTVRGFFFQPSSTNLGVVASAPVD
jgi:hypothetical protein